MATEADIPEGSEPISVTKIKEETNELNCSHLDTMVSKVSSLGELQKVGNEHCLLTSEPVEKSMNTEDKDEVSQNFNDNINNHILEEKFESIEGETFFKSTAVVNGASDQSIQGSEICEDKEILALVQKEDVVANKDVKETHDITSMNNICVQGENIEVREGAIIMEEEKQTSEEIFDDRRTLVEETNKEEIWQHQHVEKRKSRLFHKRMRPDGKAEVPSFELRQKVGKIVQTTLDHNESVNKMEVRKRREHGIIVIRQYTYRSEDVFNDGVTQTKEQDEEIMFSAESEEKEKLECASSQALKEIKDAENACQEEVSLNAKVYTYNYLVSFSALKRKSFIFVFLFWVLISLSSSYIHGWVVGHETGDINEYSDNQIIRENVSTKYQSSTTSFEEDMVQSSQANEEVEMKQDAESNQEPYRESHSGKEAIEDHCEASTGAEIVQNDNQEEEKEANKPEEEDSTGTHTNIRVKYIQEDTFENNDVVNDYCIESDPGKSITKSSQEDLEVTKELEADEAKKNIIEQIIQETEAVENYHEPSIGEETIQKANQKDENKAKEYIKEDCSGTQTITAYETLKNTPLTIMLAQ
ncbi:hypothetical protein MKW92_025183 [Papaver armeniacum]|nr:hypothetical protein MKW92_025183 [Papaver armeniacum]